LLFHKYLLILQIENDKKTIVTYAHLRFSATFMYAESRFSSG